MPVKDAYSDVFSDVKNVLVVLAHPDDTEIYCGGTIARLIDDGKKVRMVVTTNGGKGMKDKVGLNEKDFGQERVGEQMKAGKYLGIADTENFNLQIPDGEVEEKVENIDKIAFHIRQFKPQLVITHNPEEGIIDFFGKSCWVNHRDHRKTARITLDAVYPYARDRGFFPQHFSQAGLDCHSVTKLLLADSYTSAHIRYFDIGNFVKQKEKALSQHVSAFGPDEVADYIDENSFEGGYFEPLGYYKIY